MTEKLPFEVLAFKEPSQKLPVTIATVEDRFERQHCEQTTRAPKKFIPMLGIVTPKKSDYFGGVQITRAYQKEAAAVANSSTPHAIGSLYSERGGEVYATGTDKKEESQICNFTVQLIERVIEKTYDSEVEKVKLQALNRAGTVVVEVSLEKFSSLFKEIRKKDPGFWLSPGTHAQFEQYIAELYNQEKNKLPTRITYSNAGWQTIDGQNYYLSGGRLGCIAERSIPEIPKQQWSTYASHGRDFIKVGNQSDKMIPLFVAAHLGYLAKPFEDIGCPVQFLTVLIGQTGSLKTSLAKELFQCFNCEGFLNFHSTEAAIELHRKDAYDQTLMLDDIFSCSDKAVIRKFELLLRSFGDTAPRRKANSTVTGTESVPIRGAAVVTAENLPASQLSSALRCLNILVDNQTFNKNELRKFQENSSHAKMAGSSSVLQGYFASFISYVETNYNPIMQEAMVLHHELSKNNDIKFPRLAAIYRVMLIATSIVLNFWRTSRIIDDITHHQLRDEWQISIFRLIKENQAMATTSEPYAKYMATINDQLNIGSAKIATSINEFAQMYPTFIGYAEGEMLYLDSSATFRIASEEHKDRGFEVTESAINKRLCDLGITKFYVEKDGRKRSIHPKSKDKKKFKMLLVNRSRWNEEIKKIDESRD